MSPAGGGTKNSHSRTASYPFLPRRSFNSCHQASCSSLGTSAAILFMDRSTSTTAFKNRYSLSMACLSCTMASRWASSRSKMVATPWAYPSRTTLKFFLAATVGAGCGRLDEGVSGPLFNDLARFPMQRFQFAQGRPVFPHIHHFTAPFKEGPHQFDLQRPVVVRVFRYMGEKILRRRGIVESPIKGVAVVEGH